MVLPHDMPRAAGIGLRAQHHQEIIETSPPVAWLEAHPENYFGGGASLTSLLTVRRHYPVALHGVGLSLGTADGLDPYHLSRLETLVERLEPCFVSEHLSWSITGGHYFNDLLPLPLTEESLSCFADNVDHLQNRLRRRVLIENPSTYLTFQASNIPEWDFLALLVQRTGCGLLCDVNNIYVSAENHRFNPIAYLDALPVQAVHEIHLAGHAVNDADGVKILIDDHGSKVCDAVWHLYDEAVARFPTAAALIEWDTDIPSLGVLVDQANLANERRANLLNVRNLRNSNAA